MEYLLCARHSPKSFTVSHLILRNTRQGQRTVLFPFGDEETGTEWFSVSPGDTQAWRGQKRLPLAGVRAGVRDQGPVSTGIQAREDFEFLHPLEIYVFYPLCASVSSSVQWG